MKLAGLAAGAGVVFVVTTSLFGAPTICVVSVAVLPAIDVLLVVVASMQLPGVVVDLNVNVAAPDEAVAVALPLGVWATPFTAVMLQMLVLDESRVMVRTVVLSLTLVLPFASWTFTTSDEVETPSAAIGLVLKAEEVFAEVPGAVLVAMTLQPVRLLVPPLPGAVEDAET